MNLLDEKEFRLYIEENFEPIYKDAGESEISGEVPNICDYCNRSVFLKIFSKSFSNAYSSNEQDLPKFLNIFVVCPHCKRRSFIFTVQFSDEKKLPSIGGRNSDYVDIYSLYKLFRLPISNESYINEDIPLEYESLIKTVNEANYCLVNSQFIASAILFRRAIQIIAKQVLGAEGKNLFNQLEWLRENKNRLNTDLTEVFHENANIIKDIGNQGAHPDDDISLHNFSKVDAEELHDLFISIINEIFVKPKKMKELQEELKKNRKLK